LGLGAWYVEVFWWFVGMEVVVVAGAYGMMRWAVGRARWGTME
jgi:hypothetical protein